MGFQSQEANGALLHTQLYHRHQHSSAHMHHTARPGQPVPSSGHTASAGQPLPSSLPNSGSTGLSPVLTLAGGQTMAGSLVGLSTFMKSNSRGSHLLGERPMASGSPQLHEGQGRRPGHCPRRAQHRGRTCQQQLGSPHLCG